MYIENRASGSVSNIDLQLTLLRTLPTPILALSSDKRTIEFANQAARTLLGFRDKKYATGQEILDYAPADLEIEPANGLTWTNVLDGLVGPPKLGADDLNEHEVLEVEILVNNPVSQGKKCMRISVSHLTANDCSVFVLVFERSMSRNIPAAEDGLQSTDHQTRPSLGEDGRKNSESIEFVDRYAGGRLLKMRRAIFNSFDVAGYLITADERFYLTNKKVQETLGYAMGDERGCNRDETRSRLEIWNADFTRLLKGEEYPGVRLVRGKQPFADYVCGFIHEQTREKILMSVTGKCLYDEQTKEFLGGICWCRNLQEYGKFLEDKQERLLSSHETVCDVMPHMVWTTKPNGHVDWASKRWYQFTGLGKEDCLGAGYQKAIHYKDLPNLEREWEKGLSLARECEVEVRYRRYDGIYRWMLVRACPYKDEGGKILKWYGTLTDIHDLVIARIEASRNKAQTLTVLAHAEVNLFAIDTEAKLTMAEGGIHWDSAGQQVVKPDLLGERVFEALSRVPEGGAPDLEQNIRDILNGKVTMAVSEDTVGSRILRTRVVADLEDNAVDGNQKPELRGVLGLSIDVTDMKERVALELKNAQLMMEEQAAKDSNKMKSQFLANMSHEMRTPTAGVIGMVELLGDDPTLSEEQREFVNSIHLSAKALLTIVNDVLDFSKIESGRLDIEKVPFNLAMTVAELAKLLAIFAGQKDIKFVYESDLDNDMVLLGDPGRIRQVLSNLLTNALKFTKEGSVTLSVTSRKAGGILDVVFVVQDTGIGIEKKVLDKLFRPFSQGDTSTARLYGGTGLGLTICKNLASLMGGSITLDSVPSEGSTARFSVPLTVSSDSVTHTEESTGPSDSSPANLGFQIPRNLASIDTFSTQPFPFRALGQPSRVTAKAKVQSPASHTLSARHTVELSLAERKKIHVLVVEDNAVNQTIAIKTIRRLGFPVAAVWNGKEALSYLLGESTEQPRPDIILMDVQMPVMDGYEATRILRSDSKYNEEHATIDSDNIGSVVRWRQGKLSDIPVIAMTASAITGDAAKCHDAGMDDYLSKPVDKVKLEAMLVKWALRRDTGRRS